ncbi:MAG: DMT family transporter [Deltaproteobacteria bacterium]|nr:DMT family transporter [Deltaproteobacteria bacterium]
MGRWTDYLFVNAATLLWAGNVVLGRALREAVGPWTLAAARGVIASVLFAALLWRRGGTHQPLRPADRWLVAAMAISGVVGFQVLLYAGLRSTTAVNAGLVNAAGPLATVLLARMLVGTPLARRHVVGAVVSLVGVAVILSQGSWETLARLRFNPGDVLVLGAVICWALYSIAGRKLLERHPTVWVTATSTVLGALVLVGPAGWEWTRTPPAWSPGVAAALLYIGAGPSFLAFLAWNEGVRRLGPSGAMAFYNTLPLYAGLVAAVALGELPGPAQWAGGILVVGGCLLAAAGSDRVRPRRRSRLA